MIPQDDLHITAVGTSHTGLRRAQNEDRFRIQSYRLDDGRDLLLAIVADGIGGHQAGEVAARCTVDTIQETLASFDGSDPLHAMELAITEAGRAVSKSAQEQSSQEGMGSTVALALIIDDRLFIATVGDSRIYLLRNGRLRQVSTDHTWIQEAIEYDILTPEEARGHPQAHVLRRHIGGEQLPEPDFRLRLRDGESDEAAFSNQGTKLKDEDRLLLCSDGLTDMVPDMDIYHALASMPPEKAVDHLLKRALKAGGNDNITIVVVALPKEFSTPPIIVHRRRWGRNTIIAVSLLLVILAAASFGLWWLGIWP